MAEQLEAAQRDAARDACVAELQGTGTSLCAFIASPSDNALQRIATLSTNGELRLWNGASGACRQTVSAHDSGAVWADWSPCGNWLATANTDGAVKLWSARGDAGDEAASLELAHTLQARMRPRAVTPARYSDAQPLHRRHTRCASRVAPSRRTARG